MTNLTPIIFCFDSPSTFLNLLLSYIWFLGIKFSVELSASIFYHVSFFLHIRQLVSIIYFMMVF